MNPRLWEREREEAYRRARGLGADLLGMAGIVVFIVAILVAAKALGA